MVDRSEVGIDAGSGRSDPPAGLVVVRELVGEFGEHIDRTVEDPTDADHNDWVPRDARVAEPDQHRGLVGEAARTASWVSANKATPICDDYSSSARLVPYGVEVIESGTAVGVTMTGVDQQQGSGSYRGATGTATNWSVWPQDIVIKALVSIGLWGAAAIGYLFAPLGAGERGLAMASAFLLVAALPVTDEAGFVLSAVFLLRHWRQTRHPQKLPR